MPPPTSTPHVRRGLSLVAFVAVTAALPWTLGGCAWFRQREAATQFPTISTALDKDQLVEHLNANARKLEAWRSADVTISAREEGGFPISLSAFIAVQRPRNFRLRARSIRGDETDFGSNDERFWVWMRESPQKVVFTAHHEEVHRAQQRMHIPIDPDWLMETLGVVPMDPARVTLEHTDPTGSAVDLFEERVLANGQRARMVTTVDTRHGLITGRALYNGRGTLVARAKMLRHRWHGRDEHGNGGVILPHEIHLEWPEAQTTLTLRIGQVDVNPEVMPEEAWELPEMPNYPVLDLGAAVP